MANSESTTNENYDYCEASSDDAVDRQGTVDVNVLRRQRQQTFREVGFDEVAEHEAVNGYSSIVDPSPPAEPTRAPSSDLYLRTPTIDISNPPGGGGGSHDGDETVRVQQLHPPLGLISPEAGLHRDGEQARLVEVVRRRQLQQQQYYEENPLQWLEDSAVDLWENILAYGGMMEDPTSSRNPHSTMPVNPYRDGSRPTLESKLNHGQNGNISSHSKTRTNSDHPSSHRVMNGPPPSSPSSLPKHRRIIRFVLHTLLRILYAFRWSVDFLITRLAGLKPLPSNDSASAYSTSPMYTLHVSADDILQSLIILSAYSYCIFWMRNFALPTVIMIGLFIGSVSCKVAGRTQSHGTQQKIQQHASQPIAGSGAISTTQSRLATPDRSISTNDQIQTESIQRLQKQIPSATLAECKRFFKCVKFKEEAALKRIDGFFKWRSDCGLQTITEAEMHHLHNTGEIGRQDRVFDQAFAKKDEKDWIVAAKKAISIITKSHVSDIVTILPQIICSYEDRLEKEEIGTDNKPKQHTKSSLPPPSCKDRTRIFGILPSRLDLSLAAAPTYSLAAALYLDCRLSRSTTERVSLVVDVRSGSGWANPVPWSILPFVQSTASLLGSHYPERLERLVLFPMPKSAIWVWSAAEKFLDPDTSSKVVIVSARKDGSLPERLTEFFSEESLDVLEKRRRSFFLGSS